MVVCFLSVLIIGCLSSATDRGYSGISGHWVMYITRCDESHEIGPFMMYVLQARDNQLLVDISLAVAIAEGIFYDSKISFSYSMDEAELGEHMASFTGEVTGNTMTGSYVLDDEDAEELGTWRSQKMDSDNDTILLWTSYGYSYPPEQRSYSTIIHAPKDALRIYITCDIAPGIHTMTPHLQGVGYIGNYGIWKGNVVLRDKPDLPFEIQIHIKRPSGDVVYFKTIDSLFFAGEVTR